MGTRIELSISGGNQSFRTAMPFWSASPLLWRFAGMCTAPPGETHSGGFLSHLSPPSSLNQALNSSEL